MHRRVWKSESPGVATWTSVITANGRLICLVENELEVRMLGECRKRKGARTDITLRRIEAVNFLAEAQMHSANADRKTDGDPRKHAG